MKRIDIVIAAGSFLSSIVLYIRTLAPSLLYGDSAEFQTIPYTLGIGHPTGYPVYVLLARFFTLLPIGEAAYRVNLFSAFCAALTVGLIYLILRSLGALVIPALCGALGLASTSLFWKYASMAEIYTPSAACFAFILFALFQWKQTYQPGWVFAAGLAGGLSLGIHTGVLLSGIPILAFLILSNPNRATWLHVLSGGAIGFVIFFLSFLFLDRLNAPAGYYHTVVLPSLSVWGMTPGDIDSPVERLAFLYFPPQFRGQFLAATSEEVRSRFVEFTAGGSSSLVLATLGLASLTRFPDRENSSRWREAILLAAALLFFFGFAVTYNVEDFYVYYIPVIFLVSIFMALGLNAIITLSGSIFSTLPIVPVGMSLLILVVGVYLILAKVSPHWRERVPPGLEDWEVYFFSFPDQRRFEAEQMVNRLEDNAIMFTDWDNAYSYYYVAHVLQGRTGMSFHETFPQEGVTRFAASAVLYIEAHMDTRPIYFDQRPAQLADRYKITRAGSGLFQVERK
jgi:hypothetical protein